jgi:competence protein ComEC
MQLRAHNYLLAFILIVATAALVLTSLTKQISRLVFCDVGQGDAIIIIKGSTQVLIDGGPRGDAVLSCLAQNIPFWDHTIELVIITNTDADHLTGISSVLPRYRIGKVVTGDGVGESRATSQFLDMLKETGNVVTQVGQGDTLLVGEEDTIRLNVLWPKSPNQDVMTALNPTVDVMERTRVLGINVVKNVNERSVVVELVEPGFRAIFTGDIGEPTEKALIEAGLLYDVDVLKVGHHGSKFSSSQDFLDILKPEVSIISVGAKNTYGHPTDEALSRLGAVNAVVRRTDQEGDIVIGFPLGP